MSTNHFIVTFYKLRQLPLLRLHIPFFKPLQVLSATKHPMNRFPKLNMYAYLPTKENLLLRVSREQSGRKTSRILNLDLSGALSPKPFEQLIANRFDHRNHNSSSKSYSGVPRYTRFHYPRYRIPAVLFQYQYPIHCHGRSCSAGRRNWVNNDAMKSSLHLT